MTKRRQPLNQGRISAILGSTIVTTPRDWTEDFEHENGKYSNACLDCGQAFLGHKRRIVCKTCASKESPL